MDFLIQNFRLRVTALEIYSVRFACAVLYGLREVRGFGCLGVAVDGGTVGSEPD